MLLSNILAELVLINITLSKGASTFSPLLFVNLSYQSK